MARKKSYKKRAWEVSRLVNIKGNFRGAEDLFWKKVRDGFINFLKPPDWSKYE